MTGPLRDHNLTYGWALDSQGIPVPIAEAKRGERYFCPVCHGEMVPKMGDINQHHFAHLNLVQCTSENVARMVAGRWIIEALRKKLAVGEPVYVSWQTADTQHNTNVLQNITTITENVPFGQDQLEIALLDQSGRPCTVIMTGINGLPANEMIARLTTEKIMVILLNPAGVQRGQISLHGLLAEAKVWGGWWLLDQGQAPQDMITDPKTLRSILRVVANKPPYRFYGELVKEGSMSHLLHLDGTKLWLPPEVWQAVIGGTRNSLGSGVTIMIQEWTQDDRSTIALFYITARDSHAVALRYFPPGQDVVVDMGNAAFRRSSVTALELAQQLAGGLISYPH